MSHLCILICRVPDEQQSDSLTLLHRIDLPAATADVANCLDELEQRSLTAGQELMRHLLTEQWKEVDRQLVEEYRRLFPPR